jgi:hypothetical protein
VLEYLWWSAELGVRQAYFDERAGIREFDGGLSRAEAEQLAAKETIEALGPRPLNVKRGGMATPLGCSSRSIEERPCP